MPNLKQVAQMTCCLLTVLCAGCASGPQNQPMAGQRYALLQTEVGRSAQRIFPVEIYRIDGREIASGRSLHKVPPGVHSIKVRARVNRDLVGGAARGNSKGGDELSYNFQSGRRYFLGLKADSARSADWQVVVWKVEEVEAGTLDIQSVEPPGRP